MSQPAGQHASHAEALRRVLVADADGAVFESSELAGCADCAREVAGQRRVLADLEALGADERATLAEVQRRTISSGPAEAAVRARILGTVPTPAATPSPAPSPAPAPRVAPRRPAWITAVAAAAAVLAIALFVARNWLNAPQPDGDRVLGPEAHLLHPQGTVEQFTPFRWDVELPEGGHFVVRVEGDGFELVSPWLKTQEWNPEGSPAWPARIRWRLEVYRASGAGDQVASYVAWAQR